MEKEKDKETYSVQVRVRRIRHVIVNDNINSFHINTTSKNISSYQDSLGQGLETRVPFDTIVKKDERKGEKREKEKENVEKGTHRSS